MCLLRRRYCTVCTLPSASVFVLPLIGTAMHVLVALGDSTVQLINLRERGARACRAVLKGHRR